MRGQISLFEPEFIKDADCTKDTPSCVYHGDDQAIKSLVTGEFEVSDIYVKDIWMYQEGAFHGAEGGPC